MISRLFNQLNIISRIEQRIFQGKKEMKWRNNVIFKFKKKLGLSPYFAIIFHYSLIILSECNSSSRETPPIS